MQIKGLCEDCHFYSQEWKVDWDDGHPEQLYTVLENYCRLADLFKQPHGYCDAFEEIR